jgi:hypothetical protein
MSPNLFEINNEYTIFIAVGSEEVNNIIYEETRTQYDVSRKPSSALKEVIAKGNANLKWNNKK